MRCATCQELHSATAHDITTAAVRQSVRVKWNSTVSLTFWSYMQIASVNFLRTQLEYSGEYPSNWLESRTYQWPLISLGLGSYAAKVDNWLPIFRGKISVLSSRIKHSGKAVFWAVCVTFRQSDNLEISAAEENSAWKC